MSLRLFREEDAEQIARLEAQSLTHPWTADMIRSAVEHGAVFVVDEHYRACGSIRVVDDTVAELNNICVRADCRGQGLGRAVLSKLIDIVRLRGVDTVFLEVAQDNAIARAFYARLGFEQYGLRPHYYGQINAILMRRDILQ